MFFSLLQQREYHKEKEVAIVLYIPKNFSKNTPVHKHHKVKRMGPVEAKLHVVLTFTLMLVNDQLHASAPFLLRKELAVHIGQEAE
jgi:hypothetical protein